MIHQVVGVHLMVRERLGDRDDRLAPCVARAAGDEDVGDGGVGSNTREQITAAPTRGPTPTPICVSKAFSTSIPSNGMPQLPQDSRGIGVFNR
jgi:hypothetical protein